MGIEGLKSYIHKHQTEHFIKEHINLCDEIREWKCKHERKPIILIDLKGWGFNMLHKDGLNVVLGIRFEKFNKHFLKFFEQLKEAGAELKFFKVGRKLTDDDFCENIESKINQLDTKYRRYIRMMDGIENETEFKIPVDDMLNAIKSNIEPMCRDLGELHVTHSLHNFEIAEYLCNQPVMAIITDDSDLMAVDGEFEHWSLGEICFNAMDGVRYNKCKLKSNLKLISERVHMVDVLVESDSTPFGLKSKFTNLLDRLKCWYDWKSNRNQHEEETDVMKFCKTDHPIIYKLLTYEIFRFAEIIAIDFRMFSNSSYADMVVKIAMKLCGILRKDEQNRPQTRKILMKYTHEDPTVVRHEEIIYPNVELPLTYELIANPEDNDFDEYRWSLLAWVLNMDHNLLTIIRRMDQPKNIKLAVITLLYLYQHQEIRPKEAYIVLFTEIQTNEKQKDPKGTDFVVYPQIPNVNYVRMAHLYPKIHIWMNRCLEVCGLSSITDIVRFDGPLYHNLMEKFNDADATEKNVMMSAARAIWTFDSNS